MDRHVLVLSVRSRGVLRHLCHPLTRRHGEAQALAAFVVALRHDSYLGYVAEAQEAIIEVLESNFSVEV